MSKNQIRQTRIDWEKLISSQKELDNYIFERKSLSYISTSEDRQLALLVELNELANETKVFKFWSSKSMNKNLALEEFVDVLHFALSFSIEHNIDLSSVTYSPDTAVEVYEKFCEYKNIDVDKNKEFIFPENGGFMIDKDVLVFYLKDLIFSLKDQYNPKDFSKWMFKFINLGAYLGFTLTDMYEAYDKKIRINFERQNSGY